MKFKYCNKCLTMTPHKEDKCTLCKRTLTDHIESLNNIYKYEFYWSRKTPIGKGNFNKNNYIKYLNHLKNKL